MFLHAFLIETLNLSSSTAHFYDPLDDRHAGIDAAVGETKKHDAVSQEGGWSFGGVVLLLLPMKSKGGLENPC